MKKLVVLFNLKAETDMQEYENWAKTVDIPTAGGLPSIDNFEVVKSLSLFGSDATPPYQYIEILSINDLDQLGNDVSSDEMQKVAAQFQAFADNPMFILTENI
ncbi:REDY-like protein HapK [Thalassotalea psychrophila]|uniref:REDY-like protein HapK n=1 Tax=Thalassotalea psychrophila TaxID=3065647 RepID=A0ABY9TTJ2_9GAMM|nr:REDY-like protein HapK [Colwelliaceae bacterium SQ149]